MSWIRKQIEGLLRESARRQKWLRAGAIAAVAVALVVTVALVQAATAAGPNDVPGESAATGANQSVGEGQSDTNQNGEANGTPNAVTNEVSQEAENSTPIDGTSYLTQITVFRYDANNNQIRVNDGDGYVFGAGERAHVALDFTFPQDVIVPGSQTVTYSLPDGFTPVEDISEQPMYSREDASKQVGTYSISKDNRTVTLNFNDEFASQETGIAADVEFDGEFGNDSGDQQKQVVFPGSMEQKPTFSVYPVDVGITKTVSQGGTGQANGSWYKDLTYTLTVSTTHGTGNSVTITDTVGDTTNVGTMSGSSYSNFSLAKRPANGGDSTNVSMPSGQPQLGTDANGKPTFKIEGLPALEAGESYVLTYRLRVPEVSHGQYVDVKNNALTEVRKTSDGTLIKDAKTDNDTNWTASSDVHIDKAHSEDKTRTQGTDDRWTDRINYTITVSSDAGTGSDHLQVDDFPVIGSSSNIDTSTWTADNIGNVYFDHDSVKVVRVAADGSRTQLSRADTAPTPLDSSKYTIEFTHEYSSDTTPMFTIDNLTPLGAGEHYEITYVAEVTEKDPTANNTVLHNRATTRVHDSHHSTSLNGSKDDNYQWMSNDIDKSAPNGFNPATGLITWRVYVNRMNGDANGVIMNDPLPEGCDLASDVVVHTSPTPGRDVIVKTLERSDANKTDWGYSWPTQGQDRPSTYNNASRVLEVVMGTEASQYTGEFYIEFSTTAPQSGTVTNQAYETRGSDHYTSRSISVTIGRDSSYNLTKTHAGGVSYQDDGTWQMSWNVTATAKDETISGDHALTIEDRIGNAEYQQDDVTVKDSAKQYAVAKTLYAELTGNGATITLNLHGTDQNTYTYVSDSNGGHFASGSTTLDGFTLRPTLYDEDNNEISNPASSDAHVKRFTLDLVCADGKTINVRTLTVSGYHTIVSTGNAGSQTQITAYNTASYQGVQQTDSNNFITPSDTFTKQARAFNDSNWHDEAYSRYDPNSGWVDNGLSVDYDTSNTTSDKGRYVQFRLTFSAGTLTSRYIDVTDKLPDGMKLIQTGNHPVRLFRVNGDTTNDISGSLVDGNYFDPSTDSRSSRVYYDQDNNAVRFRVDTQASGQQGGNIRAGQTLFITYTVAFDSDSAWDDIMLNDKSYTNSATLDGRTTSDSTTVNVHRQPTAVIKSGNQTTLPRGELDNKITYTVDINPSGQDLDTNSDTLTLNDNLTWDSQWITPTLDLSSVHLYQYDANNQNNHIGAEIPQSNYTVKYESIDGSNAKRHMVVTVPDSMAMVLVYTYSFDAGTSGRGTNQSISNSAEISGYKSASASTKYIQSSSSSTATQQGIYIYKIDADNHAKFLSGAEFRLEKAIGDSTSSSWQELNSGITLDRETTSNGHTIHYHLVDLGSSAGTALPSHDVLYRLVETKAPDGYTASSEPTYVVWLNNEETPQQAYDAISKSVSLSSLKGDGNDITIDNIHFVQPNGGSLYIQNEYSSITVTKSWSATDGKPLSSDDADIPSTIGVKLQRTSVDSGATSAASDATWEDVGHYELSKDHGSTTDLSTNKVTTSDNGDDAWTYTWQNLPRNDGMGKDYLYRVVEDDDTGRWKATYLNDGGIRTGSITINNLRQYSLPQTGGTPLTTVLAIGGTMAVGALLALVIRKLAK